MVDLVRMAYRPKMFAQAPGAQFGAQTANHANSTVPATASLSNSAAGYTTLGGKFLFAAAAAAETDYALFAYQVPSTHRLVLNGVAISSAVAVALTTTASLLEWGLGINATAVDLSTTDSGSTFGPRRIPLGSQGFVASAAAGVLGADLRRTFKNPLLVEPSRYVHTILRIPVGAATGTFRGEVTFDGWFEPADATSF
jgi:hypothetical protein